MRRLIPLVVSAVVGAAQATPQQPVFRTGTDVIRLDVTVLGKNRRPVHGLKDADFTVYEDGKPQRIVGVAEIDGESNDPAPSAWMRHTPRDVASNDLADQTGDGRVFAIVMDDWNVPYDSAELITGARDIGHYVVDQMRPSDTAAVVFPQQAARSEDFTTDRGKLSAAVDKFQPERVDWITPTPYGTGNGGGDMPYRYSSALARSTCEREQPTIPALHTVIARLASIPDKRKTVVLISVGPPVPLDPTARLPECPDKLRSIMQDAFGIAERANINVYSVDPGGAFGYANYLNNPFLAARRGAPTPQETRAPRAGSALLRHEFLRLAGEFTGARGIYEGDIWEGVDAMLEEADSYYLVGYQTPNRPDGKFHKVEVKVNRPGVTTRTKSGYYAAREDSLGRPEQRLTPTANDLGMTGIGSPASLPLRAIAQAVGVDRRTAAVDVAVTVSVRLPAPLRDMGETLTLIRNVYDAAGRPGPPVQEKIPLTLHPVAGDELRYEVWQRLTLAPGRYQLRYNATSAALDESGTVFADVDVPALDRESFGATPIVLGAAPPTERPRTDALAELLPLVPTAAREFAANESIAAFLRVFQALGAPQPVTVSAAILDVTSAKRLDETRAIPAASFEPSGAADFSVALPLATLTHGPYLLSLTATRPDGTTLRRDVVFRVK